MFSMVSNLFNTSLKTVLKNFVKLSKHLQFSLFIKLFQKFILQISQIFEFPSIFPNSYYVEHMLTDSCCYQINSILLQTTLQRSRSLDVLIGKFVQFNVYFLIKVKLYLYKMELHNLTDIFLLCKDHWNNIPFQPNQDNIYFHQHNLEKNIIFKDLFKSFDPLENDASFQQEPFIYNDTFLQNIEEDLFLSKSFTIDVTALNKSPQRPDKISYS